MTLPLELGGIHDDNVRRALEQLAVQFPVAATGGGGAETDPIASPALATHVALTTTAHGGIVASTDPRLTDARTPTAHKTSHEPGGTDALTGLTNASIAAAAGIAKTKLANLDIVNADVNAAAAIAEAKLNLATDAAAGTGSRRTLGTTATSAAAGNRGLPAAGSSGQVLTKNSATDYDVAWTTPAGGAAADTSWYSLLWGGATVPTQGAGGTLFVWGGSTASSVSAVVAVGAANTAAGAFRLVPADRDIAGKTTNYRLRVSLHNNAVATTRNFTVGLYPVATWGGASGAAPTVATLGTVTTGSTVLFTAPAASSHTDSTSIAFAAPTAGWFCFAVVLSGAMAAGSQVLLAIELQYQRV